MGQRHPEPDHIQRMRDQGGQHARHCPSKEPLADKDVPILREEGASILAAPFHVAVMQSRLGYNADGCHGKKALAGMMRPLTQLKAPLVSDRTSQGNTH